MHHGDLERKEGCDILQIFVIVGMNTSCITLHQNCLFTIRLVKDFSYRHFLCLCLSLEELSCIHGITKFITILNIHRSVRKMKLCGVTLTCVEQVMNNHHTAHSVTLTIICYSLFLKVFFLKVSVCCLLLFVWLHITLPYHLWFAISSF